MISLWQAVLANRARGEADERSWQSQISEARALRYGTEPGSRSRALDVIRKAVAYRASDELRTEAIACLHRPDMVPGEQIPIEKNWSYLQFQVDDDYRFLALARRDGSEGVTISRISDGEDLAHLPNGKVGGPQPAFSPDGGLLFLFEEPRRKDCVNGFTVWDWRSRKPLFTEEVIIGAATGEGTGKNGQVDGLPGKHTFGSKAFSPDGHWLAIADADAVIFVERTPVPRIYRRHLSPKGCRGLWFSPDSSRVAVLHLTESFELVSPAGTSAPQLIPLPSYTTQLAWSPNGLKLAGACDDRRVHLWDVGDFPREIGALTAASGQVQSVAWSRNGEWIASANQGLIQIWDADTEELSAAIDAGSDVGNLRFVGKDSRLGPVANKDVVCFSVSGDVVCHRRRGSSVRDVQRTSPRFADYGLGGRLLATTSQEGIHFWNSAFQQVGYYSLKGAHHVWFAPTGLVAVSESGLFRWPYSGDTAGQVVQFGPVEKLRSHESNCSTINEFRNRVILRKSGDQPQTRDDDGVVIADLDGKRSDVELPVGTAFWRAVFSPRDRWLAMVHGGNWQLTLL